MATATATAQTLFLSEWIRHAVEGVDLPTLSTSTNEFLFTSFGSDPSQWPANIRNSIAVCSGDYLMSALRVARSLANQICVAEDIAAQDGNVNMLPTLPLPGTSWADRVLVHLRNDNTNRLLFNIDLLVTDYSNADNSSADKARLEHRMQRIHSLGIVFYEIFSGGERPVAEQLLEQRLQSARETAHSHANEEEQVGETSSFGSSRQNNSNQIEGDLQLSSQSLLADLDPLLNLDNYGPIDLAGELSIFDDIEDEYNLLSSNDADGVDNSDDHADADGDDAVVQRSENPRRKRQSQNENYNNIRSVSVEPLKAKGIPRSLCDLIVNMMDCMNGTLSGGDAYQKMSEVRDDLQLMLDKPSIYLYDQDMGKLSTNGLQFGTTSFGRNAELSTIKDAYSRSVLSYSGSELVLISGPSGSGKSLLAHEFGQYVLTAGGGIILSGKFDQLHLGKPFSALASAFDDYCGVLLQDTGPFSILEALASKLRLSLGPEAYHLTKIIPNLAIILGSVDTIGSTYHDEGCVNPQKRLQYLLCQFVDVITELICAPLTLFLDDLQWADLESIAVVSRLLAAPSRRGYFFFLGCCREGDINEEHPLWKLLNMADMLGLGCTNVKLSYMAEETLNTMVSETLHLSPRLTRPLSSIIYHKTKGNPLFVSRLMISLNNEGLLHPSLSRRRWEWNKEKIQNQNLPDDVAIFLTNSIAGLPKELQSSLFILSCFGASSKISFVEILEKALERQLLVNLDLAVKEGLLDKTDDQYRFTHDRIQEAAYNHMGSTERCVSHFAFGIALSSLLNIDDDGVLFAATNQLNLGGPEAVEDESQNVLVATLNLRAGKKAMSMSDYGAAYSYFDNGISFLRKNHWKEQYNLSLELFELGSGCALTINNTTSFTILSEQVLFYGHSFEDKLTVLYHTTCAMAFSSKLPVAIEKGLDILAQLGIDLRGYEQSSMEAVVHETHDLLTGCDDDDLLNSRLVTDPTMIMAMKFLGKLLLGMTQIMPKSVPYVTQRIIKLSLLHGMSPVSPIGFVYHGSSIAMLGDIAEGYHYVKLAFSLLDKVGSRESAGEVFAIGTQVRAYVEPFQAALEYYNEGYAAAMTAGDVNMAALIRSMLHAGSFFSGVNIQTVRELYVNIFRFMEENRQITWLIHSQWVQRSIIKLIGAEDDLKYFSEEQQILVTNNSALKTYCYQKAYISFMFRSYDDTKYYAMKYFVCSDKAWANTLFVNHSVHAFYMGLISFWVARTSREQEWNERGNDFKSALKRWTESSEWTFENKWYLLEAEESYCNRNFVEAKSFYEKAISSAKKHKVRRGMKVNESEYSCVVFPSHYSLSLTHICVCLFFVVRTRRSVGL
jgi:predicted ATPase